MKRFALTPIPVRRACAAAAALALALPAGAHAQAGGTTPSGSPAPTAGQSPAPGQAEPIAPIAVPPGNALEGTGMWIWILSRTYGGRVDAIVAKARQHGVRTLFIKSGDSVNYWSQFSPTLVSALKRAGLRVCAWQYVYGARPLGEAYVGWRAARAGADCLVIDAEAEYEGRYVAADQYVQKLRQLVGPGYPVALTGFPYVHYHPAFPYSVFLGPGAAQYNQPQMYWHTIGTSVDANFATTYTHNRIYKRPIFPLGQTYDGAPPAGVRRFRQLAQSYGATGVSWWSWQSTFEVNWRALGDPVAGLPGYRPVVNHPLLRLGSRGDQVVWAQQHLWSAGYPRAITGYYGVITRNAVLAFQRANGLAATGMVDAATWPRLVARQPVVVRWRPYLRGRRAYPVATARAAGGPRVVVASPPSSAALRPYRREIPRKSPSAR